MRVPFAAALLLTAGAALGMTTPAAAQGLDSALGHRAQPLGPTTRAYDQQHLALNLKMDFGAKTVSGTAEHRLLIRRNNTRRLRFHSKDTTIGRVTMQRSGGSTVPCTSKAAKGILTVGLPSPVQMGGRR